MFILRLKISNLKNCIMNYDTWKEKLGGWTNWTNNYDLVKTIKQFGEYKMRCDKFKKTGFHLLKIFVLLQKCALTVAKDITSYKKCVIFKNV